MENGNLVVSSIFHISVILNAAQYDWDMENTYCHGKWEKKLLHNYVAYFNKSYGKWYGKWWTSQQLQWTDWPQEPTPLCDHQQLHWKLDSECRPNCATVRIKLQLCLKLHFRCQAFLGICDLEHYYCNAMLNKCLRRKMGWPQNPLTVDHWNTEKPFPEMTTDLALYWKQWEYTRNLLVFLFSLWLLSMLIISLYCACVLLREGPHCLYCKWQKLGVEAWKQG